jgi:hypothetical protein
VIRFLRGWQVRTTVLIALLGPPLATFIFLECGAAFDDYGSLGARLEQMGVVLGIMPIAFIASYAYGWIPALLVGAIYCGLLTRVPSLIGRRRYRACLLAFLGAAGAFFWSRFEHGSRPLIIAAIVAPAGALLALRWPRPLKRADADQAGGCAPGAPA